MKLLYAAMIAASMAGPRPKALASDNGPLCLPVKGFIAKAELAFNEKPLWIGREGPLSLILMASDKGKRWTLFAADKKLVCLVAFGKGSSYK